MTVVPSRSSGAGPWVVLKEKTRSPESGSATIAAPTREPMVQSDTLHFRDFLVTLHLVEAGSGALDLLP